MKKKKKKKKLGFCEGCIPTGLEEGTVEEKRPREGRLARNLEAPPPPPAVGFEESDNGAATAAEDPSMARAVLLLEVSPGPELILFAHQRYTRYRG